MAFNITSWSKKGRDFGRGRPPPAGSVEYAGVGGSLFYGTRPPSPAPEAPTRGPRLPTVVVGAAIVGAASLVVAGLASRFSREPEDELDGVDELDETNFDEE